MQSTSLTASTAYARLRQALSGRHLPAAFVDLAAFDANVASVVRRAGGTPVRIASKSVRCEALLRRALNSGPGVSGIMCFTADEAVWLAERGFDDLLVAYPTVDQHDLQAVCQQILAGKKIILTVDCEAHLQALSQVSEQAGVALPVSIEMDRSMRLPGLNFGVWRSPIRTPEALLKIAQAVAASPHLELAALMGYEAQLSGLPDAMPGAGAKNTLIRFLKRQSQRIAKRRHTAMMDTLIEASLLPPIVNAGGTGCLEFSASCKAVTEVTCGSGLFVPWLFSCYTDFQLQPAAGFAIPVVRKPAADRVTCLGGGYTASGAGALPKVWLPANCQLTSTEGAGEVQTPLIGTGTAQLSLGDPVIFRHAKAGELCERFNSLLLIDNDRVVDEVPTYRGAGKCFL